MPLKDKEARAAYDRSRNDIRTASPAYLKFKENRKEIYLDRKARQVCIECEAALKPEDGLRCETCQDRHRESKERYERSPRGRRTKRKWQRRYYRKRRKRDCCVQCGKPRVEWPKRKRLRKGGPKPLVRGKPLHCPECRTKANAAQKRYRDRKKLGIASIRAEQRKRNKKRLRELRGETYVPLDELLEVKRVKIMRALRGRGWLDPETLFDIIGVPDHDDEDAPTERASMTKRLSHLVATTNFIERRESSKIGKLSTYEYRLTPSGVAQLDQIIGGKAA